MPKKEVKSFIRIQSFAFSFIACYRFPQSLPKQNRKLHNLYSSPNIIRMMKSRRMRWAGHVARMGEKGMHIGLSVGKPEGKGSLERPRRR
jgi:starvation-inducible outer membrane lipoprotein